MEESMNLDDIIIEGYCVSCKDTREIEDPIAVWTSRGQAATRGICPVCGSNMFRMGRTELHGNSSPPKPIQVIPSGVGKGKHVKAAYIASAVTDAEFAHDIGKKLEQLGIYTWVDSGENVDETEWSAGVHPALEQCTHLVVVLSTFAVNTSSVVEAWQYFLQQRKKVVVAQVEDMEPPDELRSRPRYKFNEDYKTAFREMVGMLSR